jgi:TolA-binding protein
MSVEKAVQRIHDMCVANTHRLMKLEEQFNQMSESVAQKNEKIDTQIVKIERQISEMRMETTSKLEEDKQKGPCRIWKTSCRGKPHAEFCREFFSASTGVSLRLSKCLFYR